MSDLNVWKILKMEKFHFAIASSSSCVYKNKLYTHGGVSNTFVDNNLKVSSKLLCYDPALDSWQVIPAKNLPNKVSHSMVAYKDKIYLFGSFKEQDQLYQVSLTTLETKLVSLKIPKLCFPCAILYKNKLSICYGLNKETNQNYKEYIQINLDDNTVNKIQGRKPRSRSYSASCYHDDIMWIYGGLQNQGEISDFLKYSHTLNKWKKITANGKTPGKRMASRICYGNVQGSAKIFLFGGSCNKEHLNDLWEFDISSNTWTEIHYSESQFIPYIPGPRRSHVFEYLDGVLYVIGGKIGEVYTRGVYSFRVHESKYKNYHYDQDLSSDFNNFFRKQKLFDHTITLKNNEKIGTHLQLITQSLFSPFIINNNKTKIIELISNFYESIGTGEHYSSLLDLYNDEKSTNLKINLKDNNSISFHKIVLAARSEYFNEKSITNNSDFVEIDDPFDLSYEAWKILKSYLYLGSIHEFTKKHIKLEFKQKIDKMKLYSTDLKKFLLITENFN